MDKILIKYVGESTKHSFTKNKIYTATPNTDGYGGYSIYDDGEDFYRYGEKFVKENFVIVEKSLD